MHTLPCLDHQQLPNAFRLKPSPFQGLQASKSFLQLTDLARFLPGLQNQIAYVSSTHHTSACKDVLSVWETVSFTLIMLIPTHAPRPPGILWFHPPSSHPCHTHTEG